MYGKRKYATNRLVEMRTASNGIYMYITDGGLRPPTDARKPKPKVRNLADILREHAEGKK